MKYTLLALALVASFAQAATQSIYADPVPAGTVDTASMTINGGPAIACTLPTVANGIQLKCPLTSITASGTYNIVVSWTKNSTCVNGANTATCTTGGSASAPNFSFVYNSQGTVAVPPNLKVAP